MSWLSRFTWFFASVALACLSAVVFLLNQYKQGIPYPFATNMALAGLVGVVAPLAAVLVYARLGKATSGHVLFAVFCGICLVLAGVIGAVTF